MPFQKGQVNYRRDESAAADLPETEAPDAPIRVDPIVARFQLADVPARGEWLLKRLAARWPHISEATFAGRLRAWIGSNSHHFVKGAHAVALFRLTRTELDPASLVEEVFLFTKEPKTTSTSSERDAVAIYRNAVRWATGLGASRMVIDRASDHGGTRMVKALDAVEDIEVSILLT